MKKLLLFASTLVITNLSLSQTYNWNATIGGANYDNVRNSVVDSKGNIYIHGQFGGTVDFDPSSAVFNMTSIGGSSAYILKLDSNRNFLWSKLFGDSRNNPKGYIAVDNDDNLLFTGEYRTEFDLNPNIGSSNVFTNLSRTNVFITKLNENGVFMWGQALKANRSEVRSISTDKFNNIYLAGNFQDTLYVNNNSPLDFLVKNKAENSFLLKLNQHGDYEWSKSMSSDSFLEILKISVTESSVYLLGQFIDSLVTNYNVFNTSLSSGVQNVFIHKLDINGNLIFNNNITSTNTVNISENTMELDNNENIFIAGNFRDTLFYKADTITASGTSNFLFKITHRGDLEWSKQLSSSINFNAVGLDGDNNPYFAGTFSDPIDFDPSVGVFQLTATNNNVTTFYLKLNSAGNFITAHKIQGNQNVYLSDLSIKDNNIYLTGYFNSSANFNPLGGTDSSSSNGSFDGYCIRINTPLFAVGVSDLALNNALLIYPNPSNGILNIKSTDKIESVIVLNGLGQVVSKTQDTTVLDLSNLLKGVYLLRITTPNSTSIKKIILR